MANLEAITCPFCSGTGKLPQFAHVQNGVCFACSGSGQLRDLTAFIGGNSDLVLTVWTHHGTFISADLRQRTWRITNSSLGQYKEWGRDRFYREITDADEVREIWRNAKRLGIITELV